VGSSQESHNNHLKTEDRDQFVLQQVTGLAQSLRRITEEGLRVGMERKTTLQRYLQAVYETDKALA